jgi:hypothetical protein
MSIKAERFRIWVIVVASAFCASSQGESLKIGIGESATKLNIAAKVDILRAGSYKADFVADEVQWLSQPGEPQIPWKVLTVLLPPDANLTTVGCSTDARYKIQDGKWGVEPAPPPATYDEERAEVVVLWPARKRIVGGYDLDIYETDAFWPSDQARILTAGRLREWRLAEVALPLVRYNPVAGKLLKLISADIAVTYTRGETPIPAAVTSLWGKSRVEKMAVNFQEVSQEYGIFDKAANIGSIQKPKETGQYLPAEPNQSAKGYVILTTSAIQNASTELSNFILHKQNLGFTVKVVTESGTVDSTHYVGGSTCDERAGNIRNWLQTHYESDQILYVLLIGNPHPTTFDTNSSVPMKKCTPASDKPNATPTDYFFAELTANWDKDEDGIFGEKGANAANGDEMEKYFEVYVGRIPYYGAISDLDHILQKTMNYENSTDIQWRRNVLLPMVPQGGATLSCELGEQIKSGHLEPEAIPSVRIYIDDYGFIPPPEYLWGFRYPATEWRQEEYGLVVWLTHGGSTYANCVISTSHTSSLNDNCPSATWQGSCGNSEPEESGNLAYSILKNGGIATVGATRGANCSIPERDYRLLHGSVGGLAYEYTKRLVQKQSCGEALYNTKEATSIWLENYYSFNLYGDPSVVVMPEPPAFTVSPTDIFYNRFAYANTSPCSRTYTLRNNSESPLSWTASHIADWFELSSYGGSIDPGGAAMLEIRLTGKVASFDYGTYADTVIFEDSTNGILMERKVVLEICLPPPPQQLIGYWRLDETGGTTAQDLAGTNDGALQGSPQWQPYEGRIGGALLFDDTDGTNDYVNCGYSSVFDLTKAITVAAWVKISTVNKAWQAIVAKGDLAWRLSTVSNQRRFHFAVTDKNWINGQRVIPAGEWHHVCGTYDGANLRLYIDGVEDAASPVAYAGEISTNIYEVYIGENTGNPGRGWNGMIDEVRIYNRALDADEITTIMDGGRQAENRQPFDTQENVPYRWTLSWVASPNAVYHDVYFGTSHDAVANATTDSPEYLGRQSEASYVPPMNTNTQYFWRIDEVTSGPDVITGKVWSCTTGHKAGTITREVWTDIAGSKVIDLTSNPSYLDDDPNIVEEMPSFEGPVDWGKNYGTRIHGFLTPTATGDYTFWIAGDNESQLWLSTDDDPDNAVMIAKVPGWTNPREWWKYETEQRSEKVPLTAGRAYYIRALHKQGQGGDNIAVAWQGPGILGQVISGLYLSPFDTETPSPNPMTWAIPPHPTSRTSISMTAATALDRGGVEYYFTCTSGGGHDSGWQNSSTYEDTGLLPNTAYSYLVRARDKSHYQNETSSSESYPARTFLRSDFEPDGDVDFDDLTLLASAWLAGIGEARYDHRCDIKEPADDFINMLDFAVFANDWLSGASH